MDNIAVLIFLCLLVLLGITGILSICANYLADIRNTMNAFKEIDR